MANTLKNRLHLNELFTAVRQPKKNSDTSKQDSSYPKIEYEKLFELAPVGILILDMNGVVKDCNTAAYSEGGYSEEEYIGKHFSEIVTVQGSDMPKFKKLFELVTNGGVVQPFEWSYTRKDGTIGYTEVYASLLEEKGRKLGILVLKKDITERKQAEENLKESEEKFRGLTERSPNMIFINKRGRIVYANEQCEEVMGYKREEFYAPDFNFLNLIAPESIELVKTNNIKHIQGEDVAPYEYSIITKGGNKIEAIITTTLINYEGESAILGVITDITERKRAEEALKEAENKYRDLLDNTNDLIQSVTPDGRFRYVNDAWRNALGYSEEELSNLRLFDIIHPDYLQHCEMTFQKLLSGKNVGRIKAAFVSKMGSVIMVEGDVNVKFMDGKPVYTRGIFRDITKSAYLEEHVFRLSSAISMSTDCIVITDCNAKIIDVNQKMLELYGANSEDELIGRHFLEIIDPEKRAMVNMDVKDIIEKGYLESREYNMVSKQRHKFTMQMSTSLVKAANGEPMGIVRVGNPSGKLN